MFFSRLIIAEGLGTLSLKGGTRGYFQGSFIKDERLAVALTSQVDDGEPLFAAGSARLFQHWSWANGTSTKKLLPWVVVRAGFAAALKAGHISRTSLTGWLADGQALELPDEPVTSLCCIEPDAGVNASAKLLYLYGDEAGVCQVQTIAAEPRLSSRIDGLKPAKALQGKRVAIVGVGSGGSMVAVNLAAAGVGTLHLFDKDVLSEENIFRHACDLRHLGRAKALAVRDQIASYDLPSRVFGHKQDVVKDAGDLWAAMAGVDLVLCATDSILSRRLVNYIAVRSWIPLVMACTFQNASIGEIIYVKPGASACYECTRLELSKLGALQLLPDAAESASHVPYGSEEESGVEPVSLNQGSRADVTMVAALQSRIAIGALLTGESAEDPFPASYLTWGGRSVTTMSAPFYFERPFSTNWVHLERQDECPVCGDFGRPVDKESDRAYEEIVASLQSESA